MRVELGMPHFSVVVFEFHFSTAQLDVFLTGVVQFPSHSTFTRTFVLAENRTELELCRTAIRNSTVFFTVADCPS